MNENAAGTKINTLVSTRENWIDVARGFVIVVMLIGHSGVPQPLYKYIYGFHMPFFFILSGYLFNFDKWNKLGIKALFSKRFKNYVIPYFILTFVNLFLNIPVDFAKIGGGWDLIKATLAHVGWILYSYGTAERMPNCSPLWFLLAAFISNLYFFVFLKQRKNVRIFVLLLSGLIIYALNYYEIPPFPWHLDVALIGMIFMYVGYWLQRGSLLQKKTGIELIALFIVGTYVILSNNELDINLRVVGNMFLAFTGSVIMAYIVLSICKNENFTPKLLEYFGKNTILIMAFNYAINSYFSALWERIPVLNKIGHTWIAISIADVLICAVIIYCWNRIEDKIPKLKIVTGKS